MAETSLITINNVQVYRKISPTLNQETFDAFVNEIQRKNLRNLLGDALYYDFMADGRTSGKYEELLNGKEYEYSGDTIQYYGLKPLLSYWWLALYTNDGNNFHSNYGSIEFVNNPQQNFEHAKEKRLISANYMETAQSYANDTIKFLTENSSTYTLWEGGVEKTQTQFTSFKL